MVIISKPNVKHVEERLRDKVTPKYHNAFAHRRHAFPQFIVENAGTLNKALELVSIQENWQ